MPAKNNPVKPVQKQSSTQQSLADSNVKLQQRLIELIESNNQVSKQLASTSKQIEDMVNFFREAGKYMVAENEDEKLKPLLGKISDLVEQNKTIMRGLILVQKYMKAGQPSEHRLFPE